MFKVKYRMKKPYFTFEIIKKIIKQIYNFIDKVFVCTFFLKK